MDQSLRVVWELEVGNSVSPAQGLPELIRPEGFDEPGKLAGFVDALRWGAVTSADPNRYQAPFWSGVNIEAYQLEPLRRALSAPRTNLLLADDVGLGKTIEAGLVIQELLLRHRARTVVVVCPPSLCLKWQDEMSEKFGLDFTIINSERMAEVRRSHGLHANPFLLFPRVIVSMAWLPRPRAQRLLRSVLTQAGNPKTAKQYAFDVIVVDEAHHVAPSSPAASSNGQGYATDTQRTVAVRRLAERCEHRLFLSATPHNGHPESFTALMEMIDPRRFSRGAQLDAKALREVTVRRLKSELPDKFTARRVTSLRFEPAEDEEEHFDLLHKIVKDSAKQNGDRSGGGIVAMLLKKRFLSSPYAFGRTLAHYLDSKSDVGLDDDLYDDLLGEGQADEEEGLRVQEESDTLRRSKTSDPLSAADPGQLESLMEWGLSFENRPDSRLNSLVEFLDEICRPEGDGWSDERVVVFTEYADTVEWLERILNQLGYGDVLEVIQGSTPHDARERIRDDFTKSPTKKPVRVLLATDAAGEGIDLQDHCHRLVNFDIPFNPSRLEQRIGRIDRYGQGKDPEVVHFTPTNGSSLFHADADFMSRVAKKVANVEHDLGSVNQVIGLEIQEHFTGRAPAKPKAKKVDPNEVINEALAGGLELNARLTQLEQNFDASKVEMHLEPANLQRVVETALAIDHQPALRAASVTDLDDIFEVPDLAPHWSHATRGLITQREPIEPRPFTFDPALADLDEEVAYLHLGHPLVQKAQRLLRSALWSSSSQLNRVTAVVVDDLAESFVAAVTRMVLVGRSGVRLHEDVFLAGVRLKGRRAMAEEKAEAALDKALDGASLSLAGADLRAQLCDIWNSDAEPIRLRLEESMRQRAARRQEQVTSQLAKRESADVKRAQEIYSAFRVNLTESVDQLLSKESEQVAELFPEDQKQQRRRDIRAMQERLAELSDEEAREVAGIRDRFSDVKPNTTAAAIVFALTPADAENWES